MRSLKLEVNLSFTNRGNISKTGISHEFLFLVCSVGRVSLWY